MDSGNTSGSMQSSSGGDEEYDSRADHHSLQIPSFLTTNNSSAAATASTTTAHFGHISASNQNLSSSLLSLHHHHHNNLPTTALFDPSTSYLQGLSSQSQPPSISNSNPLLNMDLLRSSSRGGLAQRSTTNCTDIGNFAGASPSMFAQQHQQNPFMTNPSSLMQSRSSMINDNGASAQHGKFPGSPSDHHTGLNQSTTTLGVRNSKKRTRASRRAPTTVLTTDTSNFRAMVQEFTGIPAPPFSSSPYSRRLDLFGSSGLRTGHLEPMGSLYPLRPSAQKIQPPANPFVTSDSSTPSLLNTSALLDNAGNTSNYNSSGSASNYLNMQNPILTFQSLLQQPPYQQQQMLSSSLQDQLGTAQGQAGQGQQQQQQHQVSVRSGGGWRGGMGSSQGPHQQLRASDDQAGYNSSSASHERSNNDGKMFSYTAAPPSDFDHQNSNHASGPASRGDGTVDSWICPSD